MALTFLNNPIDTTNMGLYGLRGYLQLWDTQLNAYSDSILDLGVVETVGRSVDTTETTIDSARNGVKTPIKTLTQKYAETFTIDSLNVTDPLVAGLFEGQTSLTSARPGTNITIRRPGSTWRARFYILQPGAPETDSMLLFLPQVELKGNEETLSAGENPGKYSFELKVVTDNAYRVPVAVLASNDFAPYGLRAIVQASNTPVQDLDALVEALKAG